MAAPEAAKATVVSQATLTASALLSLVELVQACLRDSLPETDPGKGEDVVKQLLLVGLKQGEEPRVPLTPKECRALVILMAKTMVAIHRTEGGQSDERFTGSSEDHSRASEPESPGVLEAILDEAGS
ncbi:MAG: hypothetical protein GY722_19660 [bacterium]|nr:hypothetical protein [bacterium]